MDQLRNFYESAPAIVRRDIDDHMANYRLTWDAMHTRSSEVAPGFGDPGGGIQWELPLPLKMLEEIGMVKKL